MHDWHKSLLHEIVPSLIQKWERKLNVKVTGVTGRAMILVAGGLFLLVKSTHEIHDQIEGEEEHTKARAPVSLLAVLVQIVLLDVVFSLDSVITAVGMVDEIAVMIIAVILAVIVMMIFA